MQHPKSSPAYNGARLRQQGIRNGASGWNGGIVGSVVQRLVPEPQQGPALRGCRHCGGDIVPRSYATVTGYEVVYACLQCGREPGRLEAKIMNTAGYIRVKGVKL